MSSQLPFTGLVQLSWRFCLTKSCQAVSDDLMSTLSFALSTPLQPEAVSAQKKCYVSYHLSLLDREDRKPNVCLTYTQHDSSITLLESRGLIAAGGSTGHRTWEAGLHMGQYLCLNPSLVEGKHILELGTGTGYVSTLCAKYLRAAHIIASDGSDDVINHLPENLFLNGLQDSSRIVPRDIKWGHALLGTEEEKWNGGQPVDVVLGTDITYDRRAVPALVSTLMELFALYPRMEVYISVAERNEQTFQVFLDVCQQNQLAVKDLEFRVPPRADQSGPFYDDSIAIQICHISKQ